MQLLCSRQPLQVRNICDTTRLAPNSNRHHYVGGHHELRNLSLQESQLLQSLEHLSASCSSFYNYWTEWWAPGHRINDVSLNLESKRIIQAWLAWGSRCHCDQSEVGSCDESIDNNHQFSGSLVKAPFFQAGSSCKARQLSIQCNLSSALCQKFFLLKTFYLQAKMPTLSIRISHPMWFGWACLQAM